MSELSGSLVTVLLNTYSYEDISCTPFCDLNGFHTTGNRPKESKKSLIRVKEVEHLSTKAWGMRLSETHGPTVHVTVMSPADAIAGEYSLYVETRTNVEGTDKQLIYRTKQSQKLYILFNAWCKGKGKYFQS